MTPERWQQISRIFQSALELDSAARGKYVAEECGNDEALRSAVEKLIASHQQASAENFIGGHAAEDGAALLSEAVENHEPALRKGQQFGSYLILDRLGAGGMGEVYLARDSRLDRTVALKVLSTDVSSDKRRMQRFRQEAKVASTLNQSNILTVFEFGETNGLTFLATEFIDGETLRNYLHGRRLKVAEIVDITIQILAALDAAHEAHIVHRDIKPENVMIRRRDRVVKVLDFGLAKLTERRPLATDHVSESEAATAMKTAPGTLMGTINYMSPEQAQSGTVDERTDIWSTGVMLYEMVAGVMPFGGPTVSHTLVQIIEKEPPPLAKAATGEVPAELQRIIRKALAKSAEDRYQTAKDMLIDLRSLRRQLDAVVETTEGTRQTSQKKRVLLLALLAMALVTAAIFAVNIWRARQPRPAAAVIPATTTAPVTARTLTYWITVRQTRQGKQKIYPLASEINFELKDEIRLNVRSPQAGHLYLLNEGPRDDSVPAEFVVLFPSPTANQGSSLLTAGRELQMPEETWFRFDKDQGVERVWLIFSEDELPQLEALKRYAGRESGGRVIEPAQNSAIREFLAANSNTKPDVEKSDTVTTLKSTDKILVYAIRLEHH